MSDFPKSSGDGDQATPGNGLRPRVIDGIAEFNRREYREAHETLEAVWREEQGQVRRLYQGIIQIAVGLLHAEQGNVRGATSLLERGLGNIEGMAPSCMGLEVAELASKTRQWLAHLWSWEAGRTSGLPWDDAPVIVLRGTRST